MFDSSNGAAAIGATPTAAATASPLSLPPKPSPCSTFVQADAASFKQVVQMLTGSTTSPASAKNPAVGPRKASFKLHERRGGLKNLKTVSPRAAHPPAFVHPEVADLNSPSVSWRKKPEILMPPLTLSPVTPLIAGPFGRLPRPADSDAAAGAAVAERGFSMHPSPTNGKPPRLLLLFPVTSPPRVPSA